MRYSQTEVEEALAKLRELLKPGDTVNTILRHKSRSGMSRSISLIAMASGPLELDYWASRVLGDSIDQKHGGICIRGCGMDMGFALVYDLSRRLFPQGYGCIGEKDGRRCPSNDHSNGDRDYTPHEAVMQANQVALVTGSGEVFSVPSKGHWHGDGGYALRHRWL